MENATNPGNNAENDGADGRNGTSGTSSTSTLTESRLSDRQTSIYPFGAADILLWRRWLLSFGVILVATVAWIIVEQSGLPFLSLCADVLLIVVVILFLRANLAVVAKKQLQSLPELELTEEMVNDAAAAFRVKTNSLLFMAHDITVGKDFRLFFKVVAFLWLLSVIGGFFSFFTFAYIGTIVLMTIPALYNKFKDRIDRYYGSIHQKFSNHYRIVDENLLSRLPGNIPKHKEN